MANLNLQDTQDDARRTAQILRTLHSELANPQKTSLWQKIAPIVKLFKHILFANPEEFHGKSYVPKELEDHSKLTARSISIASIINAITNQPILFFGFRDMGNLPAWIISIVLNILMIKFTNEMGTIAAGGKQGKRGFWSFAGTIGMIGMSILQSVPAVVGSEALGNGSGLAIIKAEELLKIQETRVKNMKPLPDPELEKYQKDFQEIKQEYDKLQQGDPNWDTRYVQLYGTFADKDRDWSKEDIVKLPLGQKVARLQARQNEEIQKTQKDWEKRDGRRQAINDAVAFLQKELPDLFNQHFNEDYNIKSGTELIRLATLNVWTKTNAGDWAGLGFPIFWLALSLVTSTAACCLTIAHARREDVEVSRDPKVGEAISQYLYDLVDATQDDNYPH